MPDINQQLKQIKRDLEQTRLCDRPRLQRQLHQLERRLKSGKPVDKALPELEKAIARSTADYSTRLASLPTPDYPPELPISQHRDAILEALRNNQVIILAGETGSGKTTQLPKFCLELGRGVAGLIGHTQPRRIAARSIAERLAFELKTETGKQIGYQVRFHSRVSEQTVIKLMTDGVLLAEIQHDPRLMAYDTLIIDEAHERSLNIDFILGYLKDLLPKRPDLKVIVTSATIDTERFSRHFNNAKVIEVSGRSFPVEVRYEPLKTADNANDSNSRDLNQGILQAVDELSRQGPGDVLVFLPGERQIRDAAEALRKHHPPGVEILPLFARLSSAEQDRIFRPHKGRRIVLTTNVAETALTVPGIHYVVDGGEARISRYSTRNRVQQLPIEKISRASADQRKGRCGRVADGVCIRLYAADDFEARSEFTDPEIKRTNLAAVILRMLALDIGEIESYPFMEKPENKAINDGYRLLYELGAVDTERKLTVMGKNLSRFATDPRISRMLMEASVEACLAEVLVIAGFLSVADPRERPLEKRQQAAEAHKEYISENSEFIAIVNLWNGWQQAMHDLSRRQLRRWCSEHFLSFMRMLEWRDIYQQLHRQVKEMRLGVNDQPAAVDNIHRAVLSGLISQIGFRDEEKVYKGSHGKQFRIFPGSPLCGKSGKWVMAAQLIETRQLYAHIIAPIKTEWVERLAQHLTKQQYSDIHFDQRSGGVMARVQVSLFGLVLVAARRVYYGSVNPQLAREYFIREGLVQGLYQSKAASLLHNRALLEEVGQLEHKSRRRDLLADEQLLYTFYDAQVPARIVNAAGFEKWLKKEQQRAPDTLKLTREHVLQGDESVVSGEDFPDVLNIDGIPIALQYYFDPADEKDGVTAQIPLAVLNQLQEERFAWLVPGLIRDKIIALMRALPKPIRRKLVPIPDFADACLLSMQSDGADLYQQLGFHLQRITGVSIAKSNWNESALSDHLRMRYEVLDEQGKLIESSRSLLELQGLLGDQAAHVPAAGTGHALERDDIRDWDFDELPTQVKVQRHGIDMALYPALTDVDGKVSIRLYDTPKRADAEHLQGLQALFSLTSADKLAYLRKHIPHLKDMCLHYTAVGNCDGLKSDFIHAILADSWTPDQLAIRNRQQFQQHSEQLREQLITHAGSIAECLAQTLQQFHQLKSKLGGSIALNQMQALADIKQQLDWLIYPGFIRQVAYRHLQHYPRYLKAIQMRLERLQHNVERDRPLLLQLQPYWSAWLRHAGDRPDSAPINDGWWDLRWQIEEFRVSLFAQELKTSGPVSAKRLDAALRQL